MSATQWIPAFAGMTSLNINCSLRFAICSLFAQRANLDKLLFILVFVWETGAGVYVLFLLVSVHKKMVRSAIFLRGRRQSPIFVRFARNRHVKMQTVILCCDSLGL